MSNGHVLGLALCGALVSWAARADYMDHFVVRDDVGPRKGPSFGESRILVIPVEVAGYPPLNHAALESFFADANSNGFSGYYRTASLGRFRPQVTVAPTVVFSSCPLPADLFPQCAVGRGDLNALTAGMNMLREVVSRADQLGVDYSAFDVNGRKGVADGWVDGVMVLTNTPFGGVAFPFAYFNRGDNLAGGNGGPLLVDGKKIGHLAIAGGGQPLVLVHEFGHLLGLTDLYDESGRYDGLNLSWMGSWTYDANIPLPDAESRFRLRWAQWHQVQGRRRVVVGPAESTGDVYRLGVGDEYFLVENRGPGVTFDLSLRERGLAVFHVDRRVKLGGIEGDFVNRLVDCVNCDPWHPYIGLLQADGRFEIEKGAHFNLGDLFATGSSLTVDSSGLPPSPTHQGLSSNWYSGADSGIRIEDVQVRADGFIEVTLEAPISGQCDEAVCAQGEGCTPADCGEALPTPPASCGCASATQAAASLVFLLLRKQRFGRRKQRLFGRA